MNRTLRSFSALLALLLPSSALATTAAVSPLVGKAGIDDKALNNITAIVSTEIEFMADFEEASELPGMPSTMNIRCLSSSSCLKAIGKDVGVDQLFAGSAMPAGGESYEIYLVLFDVGANKFIRKRTFTVEKATMADNMSQHVRGLVSGEAAVAAAESEGTVEDNFDAMDDFSFDDDDLLPTVSTPGNSRRTLDDFEDEGEDEVDREIRQAREREDRERREAEARRRADDERRARAEAQRREEEEEARRRARAEAERRAQAEADRRRQEEDDRRRAQADADRRAQVEADRRRQDEDDRRRAEAEAEDFDDFQFGSVDLGDIDVDDIQFGEATDEISVSQVDDYRDSSTSDRDYYDSYDDRDSRSSSSSRDRDYDDRDSRSSSSSRDRDYDSRSSRDRGYDDLDRLDSDLDDDRRSSSSRDRDRASDMQIDGTVNKKSGTRLGLTLRAGGSVLQAGPSPEQRLEFVTYGAELSIPLGPVFMVVGLEGYTTQRPVPEEARDEFGGRETVYNTIAPFNVGVMYQSTKRDFRPYVGADLTLTPYTREFGIAPGGRGRVGADIMLADNFGLNINASAGAWYGRDFGLIQEGMQPLGIVPQGSVGTVIRF